MTAATPSVRQAALAELVRRLEQVAIDNNFQTNAGQKVFLGEAVQLGPDDPEATIAVVVQPDNPTHSMVNVGIELTVEIVAVVRENAAVITEPGRERAPWFTIEAILADIKRAVETDYDLGGILLTNGLRRGSTRPLEREAGSEFVGASVEYVLHYAERWGQP